MTTTVGAPAPVLAERLLRAVRGGDEVEAARVGAALAALAPDALAGDLPDDRARVATWLNVYNAAAQRLVARDPAGDLRRSRLFGRPAVTVAGTALSLDAIEHGLLRRSRWKLGLGWLGNPAPGSFERRFRVGRVDPRVHFALNCAAASCPPIAAYEPARLDAQLDLATRAYLASAIRDDGDRLVVPRVFLWFIGDFGGPAGVRRFLARHGVDDRGRRLRFDAWDWTPAPGAWSPPDARTAAGDRALPAPSAPPDGG